MKKIGMRDLAVARALPRTSIVYLLMACFLFCGQSALADGELQFASLGDFRLENGETIRDCRLGYRTFGHLNEAKSNAVLWPTWFTGTTENLAALIGPGKLIDSAKFFLITVDALADGVSSSPSNSKSQPRMKFPRVSIRDMVNTEHQFVTQVLHLSHLRAVMGISMGGMQTFQWILSYPDFIDRAVPIVGSPRQSSYDLLLWNAQLHAIEADAAWNHGDYSAPPDAGLRTAVDIQQLARDSPGYRARETPPEKFEQYLTTVERIGMKFDANDRIRQLEAMIGQDVSKPFGGDMRRAAAAVKAKLLVVPAAQDHMVNPIAALEFAHLAGAETVVLEGDCGHVATNCEQAKIAAALHRFLSDGL